MLLQLIYFSHFNVLSIENGDPCTTPNGERAECKPINDCNIIKKILRRRGKENVEFLLASQCDYDDEPLVCCGTKSKFDEPSSSPKKLTRVAAQSEYIANREICGRMSYQDRILGGKEAGLDEFPWMALIAFENKNEPGKMLFKCGGSLIASRYILTAAHCFLNKDFIPVKVRLGEWNLDTDTDCVDLQGYPDCSDKPQDIDIESITVHPQFQKHHHDIALVRLAKPANYSDFVKPICLPTPMDSTKVGANLTVSGWGLTERGVSSPIKMKLIVPKKSRSFCKGKYMEENIRIIKGHLCAGGVAGEDACLGDSGGPLMNNYEDKPTQLFIEGVVSFGRYCGTPGWPGVYTRVTKYLGWIYSTVV